MQVVRPARNLAGVLYLPGDKSISHRYAMLAAIADGQSRLQNFSTGADCASTLVCLENLGVNIQRDSNSVVIAGRGRTLCAPASPLDCGNSGSTMRMTAGILAGQDFDSELRGDASLSRRPMRRVITPLEKMGAAISAADGDKPPLRISGGQLHAIHYEMPVASAQVKSAILLAALFADGETCVREPVRTRDHTELALRAFGAEISVETRQVSIKGHQKLRGIEANLPGDISTAAFFLCAAALFPDSSLTISRLLMNPTRARLLDVLISIGLNIAVSGLEEQHGELVGTIEVSGARLKGAKIFGRDTAALIDEIPVLAAIAPYTEEGMEIRDAAELRVKESDRIQAIVTNLRAMGGEVQELDDGIKIPGRQRLDGAEIESFGDHRIAMAFAIAALRADGETAIHGADAAVISYPDFFESLDTVVER